MRELLVSHTDSQYHTLYPTAKIILIGPWFSFSDFLSISLDSSYASQDYHWDNRSQLFNDFHDLQQLYEELLPLLALYLNQAHGTNYTTGFWRILAGPWLNYFIQISFDRWKCVSKAHRTYPDASFALSTDLHTSLQSSSTNNFLDQISTQDWNNGLCASIASLLGVHIEHIPPSQRQSVATPSIPTNSIRHIPRIAITLLARLFLSHTYDSSSILLISTGLPVSTLIKLSLSLRVIPRFSLIPEPETKFAYDTNLRTKIHTHTLKSRLKSFTRILSELIPQYLPTSLLEGFSSLNSEARKHHLPLNPHCVYDAYSWLSSDTFKYWLAFSKEKQNTKIILLQHGGSFGSALFNSQEDHQLAIADVFVSWGWSRRGYDNIIPVGNTKCVPEVLPYNKNGGVLLVQACYSPYSYTLYSVPIGGYQAMAYLHQQFRFINSLPTYIQQKLILKAYPIDYGMNQPAYVSPYKDIVTIERKKSIRRLIRQSRVYVSTYNATTYLESLHYNIPTIIYWDQRCYEVRPEFLHSLKQLQDVGIYHPTPEGAASHLRKVWNSIDSWWFSQELQEVRQEFCQLYSKPINDISKFSILCKQSSRTQ